MGSREKREKEEAKQISKKKISDMYPLTQAGISIIYCE